jgi:hypothetical protein
MRRIFTVKKSLLGLALVAGMYGLAKLILRHDLVNGIWSLIVCLALCAGFLSRRFFETAPPSRKTPPNKRPLGLE